MLARRTEPLPGNRAKSARPRPLFYGWYVVAAAFAVTCIGFGCAYSFGAFVRSLEEDIGGSRGSVSAVFSLAGFLYFGLGTLSGPLADRWGSRRLVLLGMLLTGFGLAMASLARNLMEIYAAYGFGIGLGVAFSYVPALAAVQRWFDRRRGLASGLAVSGIGTGTLSMPPLASYLIGELGWRAAYLVLALLAVAIGASMALLLKDDPSECGLAADGSPVGPGRRPPQPVGARLLEALRSRQFVGLYLACLVCSLGVFLPFVHLVPYALERGIAPIPSYHRGGVWHALPNCPRLSWLCRPEISTLGVLDRGPDASRRCRHLDMPNAQG
jgi:MFS family permease